MITFEAGKTYQTHSICDHNCIFGITVVSRTDKTLKTKQGKTLRIKVYGNAEQVKPLGSYSMAPIIDATQVTA